MHLRDRGCVRTLCPLFVYATVCRILAIERKKLIGDITKTPVRDIQRVQRWFFCLGFETRCKGHLLCTLNYVPHTT